MNKNTKSKVYNHTLFSSASVQPTTTNDNNNNDPNVVVVDTSTNIGTTPTTTSNVSSVGSNPQTPIQQSNVNPKTTTTTQLNIKSMSENVQKRRKGGLMSQFSTEEQYSGRQSSPSLSKKKAHSSSSSSLKKKKLSTKILKSTAYRAQQQQFKKNRKPIPINQVRPINKKIMDFIGMVGSYTGITHIEKYLNTVNPALYEEEEESEEEESEEEEEEEESEEEQMNIKREGSSKEEEISNVNIFTSTPIGLNQTPTLAKPFISSPSLPQSTIIKPLSLFSPSLPKPTSTSLSSSSSFSQKLITPSKISLSNIFSEINRLEDASFQIHSHALTAYTLLNNRFPYLLNGAPDYHIFIYYGNNMVLSLFANLVAAMMNKTKFIVPTTVSFDKNYMRINTNATLLVQRLGEYRFDVDTNTFIHFNEKNDEITSYTSFTGGGGDGSQSQQRSIFANGNNATMSMYPSFMLNRQNSMF